MSIPFLVMSIPFSLHVHPLFSVVIYLQCVPSSVQSFCRLASVHVLASVHGLVSLNLFPPKTIQPIRSIVWFFCMQGFTIVGMHGLVSLNLFPPKTIQPSDLFCVILCMQGFKIVGMHGLASLNFFTPKTIQPIRSILCDFVHAGFYNSGHAWAGVPQLFHPQEGPAHQSHPFSSRIRGLRGGFKKMV